jgi:uncharacterized membrane protein YjgN (DUF898 family)
MNEMRQMAAGEEPASAFVFTGEWREFLPIALTNLLLTVVTLGFYRFWAKARERRYLWSRTRFIDDHLEWTGTGTEMFIGFLIVMAVLIPIGLFFQFGFTAMVFRGEEAAAILIAAAIYIGIFYLIGVGQFRALRYRLSRTWWHGIRGGSEDGGWSYGWSYLWKTAVGWLAAGMMVPWSMTSLWNERWNKMSFGDLAFRADAEIGNLIVRWLLIYLSPFIGMLLMGVAALIAWGVFGGDLFTDPTEAQAAMGAGFILLAFALFYLGFLVASLSYYAAFFRQVGNATTWGGIRFAFNARTRDWLKLVLGNVALVVFTLGAGLMFIAYRNWSFAVRHLEASGEVHLDALRQSLTPTRSDAEGIADAFDIGAV